ncbi:MAG: hypothetical protein KC561_06760, partial [Myxococcales bacterium]|nr:hypothetical protein [Myxococcales bacterium]
MDAPATSIRTFDDIVGHREALDALRRAFEGGRGHHAYLFSGPSGIGKRSIAEVLGRSLLCSERRIGFPCGHCGPCTRVIAGSHADWMPLEPEGTSIKISTIRRLNHEFTYRPFEGGARIVLLDNAELL